MRSIAPLPAVLVLLLLLPSCTCGSGDDGVTDDADVPCPAALRCGPLCCAAEETCDLGRCRPDCGLLAVCGDPPACCDATEACLGTTCVPLGDTCGRCTGM